MLVSTKGQVTIPLALRLRFGIEPGTELEFVAGEGDRIELRVLGARQRTRGQRIVARARGRASRRLTTDEIMALTRDDA